MIINLLKYMDRQLWQSFQMGTIFESGKFRGTIRGTNIFTPWSYHIGKWPKDTPLFALLWLGDEIKYDIQIIVRIQALSLDNNSSSFII